jgi:hypothetical protein
MESYPSVGPSARRTPPSSKYKMPDSELHTLIGKEIDKIGTDDFLIMLGREVRLNR